MQGTNEFAYARAAAEKYGNLFFVHELDQFAHDATDQQLRELAAAYVLIQKKGDANRISRWMDDCDHNAANIGSEESDFRQHMARLLVLFRYLGKERIAPFSSQHVQYIEAPRIPNWNHLPHELAYLREPAEKYGIHSSEPDVLAFLERAGPEDIDMLARTAERIRLNGHNELIDDWLTEFPFDEHQEAWLVYWLFGVMDHAGLSWT